MVQNNSKKFRLTCTAPSELTLYNKKWNADLRGQCYSHRGPGSDKLFQPDLRCAGCPHLEVKGYK